MSEDLNKVLHIKLNRINLTYINCHYTLNYLHIYEYHALNHDSVIAIN